MQSTQPANPYGFDDLTPIAEASKENVFIKALNWALLNKKIKNIAVTGPYGSGKSSMLEAFITVSPEHKYLKISLASFRGGEEEEGGEEPNAQKKNEAHRLLELSILQQIFYKVKDSDLPDSRFKRIRNLTVGKMALLVGLLLLTLISVLALIFRSYFENISFFCGFSASHPDLVILLPFSTLLPGFVWLVVSLQRFFNRSGFKKLNISSGEIEINPKSETSILNKYLDEIVYFFEVNFYDIAIIEDLDRFNDPEIFTKLRELNQLLNNSSQLNRHIVFIYAIRDDIFPDQRARTKFFDFILPVIPVINWSNSLQKLWDKLNEPAYGLVINERFVTAITLYIDDMRVLKNIFNELMLYKES
ncbi:MAG TPA: hypothetical protein VK668_16330, partial [Mucilaginibacter sp.]|nr:hypothetical protein [Mucilaginibacter sp.]